ncbi:MAG: acylphosphatase [Gammaproteobacteria bacterium]|nr:acylphosphatase [Gammaproteobacteria bacterium]
MTESVSCVRFQVSGRVQGVGFRYAAMQEATRIGVSGWVKNLSNGDVELVVCSDDQQLAQLESWLQQGPRFAQVSKVEREPSSELVVGEFEIR